MFYCACTCILPLLLPVKCCADSSLFSPFIAAHKDNNSVLAELFSTLSKLAVRNEFCQEIMDLGALDLLTSVLVTSMNHQVTRNLFYQPGICFVLIWTLPLQVPYMNQCFCLSVLPSVRLSIYPPTPAFLTPNRI